MMEMLQLSKKKTMVFLAAAVMLLWSVLMPQTVKAADGMSMSTDYPGITMKAGETTTVTAVMKASKKALPGDYIATMKPELPK